MPREPSIAFCTHLLTSIISSLFEIEFLACIALVFQILRDVIQSAIVTKKRSPSSIIQAQFSPASPLQSSTPELLLAPKCWKVWRSHPGPLPFSTCTHSLGGLIQGQDFKYRHFDFCQIDFSTFELLICSGNDFCALAVISKLVCPNYDSWLLPNKACSCPVSPTFMKNITIAQVFNMSIYEPSFVPVSITRYILPKAGQSSFKISPELDHFPPPSKLYASNPAIHP